MAENGTIFTLQARIAHRLSMIGERWGVDSLVYNPFAMRVFHWHAKRNAPAVIGALREVFPEARRYADVGAGSGAYVAEAARQGLHAVGCERSPLGRLLTRAQGARVTRFDLDDNPPARLPQVDVAYCIEVAEHVPPPMGDRLVEFLCGLAPVVMFTAATPGQGGTGHVNEQPHAYWDERFARFGYVRDGEATEEVRAGMAARGAQAHWLRNNAMVFRAAAAP